MSNVHRLPVKPVVVLDRDNPMASARRLVAEKYTVNGRRLLHRHGGEFWQWHKVGYRRVSRDEIRAVIRQFLQHAKYRTARGELVDFQPNRGAGNLLAALAAVCSVDEWPVK